MLDRELVLVQRVREQQRDFATVWHLDAGGSHASLQNRALHHRLRRCRRLRELVERHEARQLRRRRLLLVLVEKRLQVLARDWRGWELRLEVR